MQHPVKDHCAYHIHTEDENGVLFLGDFNCSNPTVCTNVEIDEFISSNDCYNSCSACSYTVVQIIVAECSGSTKVATYTSSLENLQDIEVSLGTRRPLAQQPPPPNIPFTTSPIPTRLSTIARQSSQSFNHHRTQREQSLPPPEHYLNCSNSINANPLAHSLGHISTSPPLDCPILEKSIRLSTLYKLFSSIYSSHTIILSWNHIYPYIRSLSPCQIYLSA